MAIFNSGDNCHLNIINSGTINVQIDPGEFIRQRFMDLAATAGPAYYDTFPSVTRTKLKMRRADKVLGSTQNRGFFDKSASDFILHELQLLEFQEVIDSHKKQTAHVLYMQYYTEHNVKATKTDILALINYLVDRIKGGSFNPYGNGQTVEPDAYARRLLKRELDRSLIPQKMRELINEEMQKFEEQQTKNNNSDIKHSRSLNYFRRDFEKATQDEGLNWKFEYLLNKFKFVLEKQGYDVIPTPENLEVIRYGLDGWRMSGTLMQFDTLSKRLDKGLSLYLKPKPKGKKVRKVILKYSYLLDIPKSVSLALKVKSQGFLDWIMDSAVGSALDSLKNRMSSSITNTWEAVKGFIENIYRQLLSIWQQYSSEILLGVVLVGTIVLLYLTDTTLRAHVPAYFELVTGKIPNAQVSLIHTDFIAALVSSWKGIKDTTSILKELSFAVTSTKNIVEFIKSTIETTKEVLNWTYKELWGTHLFKEYLDKDTVRDLHVQLVNMVSIHNIKDYSTIGIAKEFSEAYVKVLKYVSVMQPRDKASVDFLNSISRQMRDWRCLYQICQHTIAQDVNAAPRIQPIGIYLYGETSAGKTYFANLLFSYLSLRYRGVKFTANDVYSRNASDDFWSGYTNQWICQYDEFLQSKNQDDRIKQANECIDAINTKTWALVMPGLEDKGNTFFRSEIVIITSNEGKRPLIPIQKPEAFYRRVIAIDITENEKAFVVKDGKLNLTMEELDKNYGFTVTYAKDQNPKDTQEYEHVKFSELIAIFDEVREHNIKQFNVETSFDPDTFNADVSLPNDYFKKVVINKSEFIFKTQQEHDQFLSYIHSIGYSGDMYCCILSFIQDYLKFLRDEPVPKMTSVKFNCLLTRLTVYGVAQEILDATPDAQGKWDFLPEYLRPNPFYPKSDVKIGTLISGYTMGVTRRLRQYVWNNKKLLCLRLAHSGTAALFVHTLQYSNGHEIMYFMTNKKALQLLDGQYDIVWESCKNAFALDDMDEKESKHPSDVWGSGLAMSEEDKKLFPLRDISGIDKDAIYILEDDESDLKLFVPASRKYMAPNAQPYYDFWSEPASEKELIHLIDGAKHLLPPEHISVVKARLETKRLDKLMYYTGIAGLSILSIGFLALGITAAVTAISYAFGYDISHSILGQSSNPHMKKWEKLWNKKRSMRTQSTRVVTPTNNVKAQSYSKTVTSLSIKVANNTRLFKIKKEGRYMFTPATFIHARTFVFPAHALVFRDFDLEMYLNVQEREEYFAFNSKDLKIKLFKDRDFALVQFPKNFPGLRSLLSSLKEEIPESYKNLTRISFDDEGEHLVLYGSSESELLEEAIYSLADKTQHANPLVIVARGCRGVDGDCGFWYIEDGSTQGPLVGIHVAGRADLSYVCPIFKKDIEDFLEETIDNADIPEVTAQCLPWLPEKLGFQETVGNAEIPYPKIGEFEQPLYQPSRTALERSPLFNGVIVDGVQLGAIDYPDILAPARLKPFEGKDPSTLAFRKANKRVRKPPPEGIEDPELWIGIFPKFQWRPCTQGEIMDGIPGLMASFETNKSVGHPAVQLGINKKQWIRKSTDEGGMYHHRYILHEIELFEQACKERKLYMPTYLVYLKDELRTLDKVAEGYTRAFFASPKWFIMKWKCYFGLWMAYVNLDLECPIKVGINPYSMDWWNDFYKIKEFGGDSIIAQDVSAWDLYFWYWFGPLFAKMFCKSYNITDKEVIFELTCLCIAHFWCYIVLRKSLYLFDGMTSGGPGTAHLNSAGNVVKNRWIVKRILWDSLHIRIPINALMYIMTFGDDLHETIKRVLLELNKEGQPTFTTDVITPILVAEYALKYFGHTHTTADKKQISQFDSMETAEFLKRKHIKIDGVIMCPMNIDSLRSHLLWINKDSDLPWKKQFTENVHNALREFFFHGRAVFEMEKERLNKYLKSINEKNQFFETYDDLMVKYLDGIHKNTIKF